MERVKARGGRPPSAEKMEPHMIRLPAAAVREIKDIAQREAAPLATVLRRLVLERLDQMRRERAR